MEGSQNKNWGAAVPRCPIPDKFLHANVYTSAPNFNVLARLVSEI